MDFNSKEKSIEQIKTLNDIRSSYWKKSSEFKIDEFKEKVIHIMYKQKEYYDGEINEDFLPNGQGFLQFDNGDYYVGDFVNGVKEGLGQYYYNDGLVYSGFWKEDIKEGDGVVSNKSQNWEFIGKFKDDKPYEGYMTYYSGNINDDSYDKELNENIKNISINLTEKNKSIYKTNNKNIITNEDISNTLEKDIDILALKSPIFNRPYNSKRFYSTKNKSNHLP